LDRLAGPSANPRLKVFIAYEAPENFTGAVRDFGPSHVLVIDAAAGGYAPGTVFAVEPAAIPDEDVSTHRTPISTLAAYLEKTLCCRVVVLGIEPGAFETREALTPGVQAAVEKLSAWLAAFVDRRLRSSSASGHRYS
jgi:hydrogenase 3 maturation protease